MIDEENLLENAAQEQTEDEQDIESTAVGVGAETDAEGSSQTPKERLERIAAEHDVPIDRDPAEAQAKAEGSSYPDKDRDISGGDTKEEEDDSVEPPD